MPFCNHLSSRRASSSRNAAFATPQKSNPRRAASCLVNAVFCEEKFIAKSIRIGYVKPMKKAMQDRGYQHTESRKKSYSAEQCIKGSEQFCSVRQNNFRCYYRAHAT